MLDIIRALMALGQSFADQAAESGDDRNGLLLTRMAAGFGAAARKLDKDARAACSGQGNPEAEQ